MKTIGRFLIVSSLIVITATLCGLTAAQAACHKLAIGAAQETIKGNAFLCPGNGGVTAKLEASGLIPGNVYTFWFIYIPDGAACAADEATCFGASAGGGQQNIVPAEAFGRISDAVAPKNGKATISGSVPGLQLSSGSQVWLLLKGHGTAKTGDNLALARQLLTPEDPTVGAPNLGIIGGNAADNAALTIFNN
jgi:hypothetical protein